MSIGQGSSSNTQTRGPKFDARYRTVEEPAIVQMLLLAGFAFDSDPPQTIAIEALNRWVSMGLGVTTGPAGDRRFDPVEVVCFLKRTGLDHRDAFWSDFYVETGRRLVRGMSASGGQRFTIDFRRSIRLEEAPMGQPVRVRAPLPLIADHGRIADLCPFIEGAPQAHLQVADGRLEARFIAQGQSEVTLGASFRIAGADHAQSDDPAHPSHHYLKPAEGLIVVSSAVRELAERLAAQARSEEAAVRAFWNYMIDELACGPIHYDQVDPVRPCDWVIQSGWYDCQLGACLFIALCRARNIPARLVSGHLLYGRAPTNHYWAEARLEDRGWTPFDFLSWDLSRAGRDRTWRDCFFGRIDHRMVMQRLPFAFTGAPGVALPPAFHMLQRRHGFGVSLSLDRLDRRTVYRDFISVSP